jgi:hypothetical protein
MKKFCTIGGIIECLVIAAAVMILFFQSVPDQTSTPAAGPEEND